MWLSYQEVLKKVDKISNQLATQRLEQNEKGLVLIGILAKNCANWIMFDIACSKLGITTIGLYETHSSSWLTEYINKLSLNYICCTSANLFRLINLKKEGKIPTLRKIFLMQKPNAEDTHLAEITGIFLIYYSVNSENPSSYIETSLDKICILALTSGVSNEEMRVCMVSNRNLLYSIYGANFLDLNLSNKDIYISYVHLSLLWERVLLYKALLSNSMAAFSDLNSGQLGNDLKTIRPTVILGIPKLLETMHNTIQEQISNLSGAKKSIFNKAYQAKLQDYKKSGDVSHKIWDKFVFKQIRSALGGRLRLMITGSALYNPGVIDFLKIVMSCQIVEGYGSMETLITCMCSIPGDKTTGHVGGPLPGVDVKLKKIKDLVVEQYEGMEYGELCVRGEKVFLGYYCGKDNGIDQDGWLHTGDIFAFLKENSGFKFVGILGTMGEFSNGVSISLTVLENIYRSSSFISQIYLTVKNDKLIAVAVPNETYIMSKWAPEYSEFSDLCDNVLLNNAICKDLEHIHWVNNLKPHEKVYKIYLEKEPWISDEVLSPTLKIRRKFIEKHYSEILETLALEDIGKKN